MRRVWDDLWQAKYREPYIYSSDTGVRGDDWVLKRVGSHAKERGADKAEEVARHWVKSFLRDSGGRNWLSENRHPLRCIEKDLHKFGMPTKPKPARAETTEPAAVPLSVEEQKQRAEALAGLVGKIGAGR
jgi:hypothetical protein